MSGSNPPCHDGKPIGIAYWSDSDNAEAGLAPAHTINMFLEDARESGAKKAAKGLSSALEVMERNPEVRHRMLYAAYHEAVTGRRLFREEVEEETAREIFEDPFEVDRYLAYGECLEAEGHIRRAERVYRVAMEFFPDDEEVRRRLEAVAQALEPEKNEEVRERIRQTELEEKEEQQQGGDE